MGYSNAQYSVAIGYEYGDGVEKNLTKAYNWYKKAANQNHNWVSLRLKKEIFKNFDLHENARNALLCLIAIKKFRNDSPFIKVPMDVVKMIAKEVWETRNDVEWTLFIYKK